MVCTPSSNNLAPPSLGPPPDIGFGPIFSPVQIPFPDLSLPAGIPEDIIALLEELFALIPGGKLIPSADGAFDSVFDAIASLMNMLSPYLALYNFFQALLNMVICIIEVLCALMNPFKTIKAIRKLFKQCIPAFLSIFPFLALIAMILALILLLIALIEYLINTIIAMINDLIANLEALAEAVQVGNETGIIAIAQKIAALLCLIEQLFALLIIFQALFKIIEALAQLGGVKPCKRGNDCCDNEVCPPFIGDNPNGTTGVSGRLIYHRQYGLDVGSIGIPGFQDLIAPLRAERWQFVDDGNPEFPFDLIITPHADFTVFPPIVSDSIYWPQPLIFQKGDSITNVVPYTLDMTINVNPLLFGHSATNGSFTGARDFKINDIIITRQPYRGVLDHENELDSTPSFGNNEGTLRLIGGLVFESDGTTPFNVDGEQATLDTFIVRDEVISTELPSTEDGYQFSDITWNMKINHAVLMKYQIITAGCQPEIQVESAIADIITGDVSAAIQKIGGSLPDVSTALNCLSSAMAILRADVSPEGAAIFQATAIGCLETLKAQSEDVYTKSFIAGVSPYESSAELIPEIQFVDAPIRVEVTLRDFGGNEISEKMPQSSQEAIAELLEGTVTFGDISDFRYDGYSLFVADITSSEPGSGDLQIAFDGNLFSEILNQDNLDVETEIRVRNYPYQFIGGLGADAKVRRDETDVSNS